MDDVDNADPARCPLCAEANACGAVAGAATCWCYSETIAPAVLARIPPAAVGVACVCARCARGDCKATRRSLFPIVK